MLIINDDDIDVDADDYYSYDYDNDFYHLSFECNRIYHHPYINHIHVGSRVRWSDQECDCFVGGYV